MPKATAETADVSLDQAIHDAIKEHSPAEQAPAAPVVVKTEPAGETKAEEIGRAHV